MERTIIVENVLGFAAQFLRYLKYARLRRGAWTDGLAQQHHGVIDFSTFDEAGNSIGFAKVQSVDVVANFAREVEEAERFGRCSHGREVFGGGGGDADSRALAEIVYRVLVLVCGCLICSARDQRVV